MRSRKYAGVALGIALSVLSVASALAATIGPNAVTVSPGWN